MKNFLFIMLFLGTSLGLLLSAASPAQQVTELTPQQMPVVEWIQYQVPPAVQADFIEKDEQIWTAFLSTVPGFISKEVLVSTKQLNEILILVHWVSREAWFGIERSQLERVQAQFVQQVGTDYPHIVQEYQVRRSKTLRSASPAGALAQ
jgi:uncharacterized protein (TIGR03792 family)